MGRVFKFHNDVDTDQIIASQYLLLPNIEEMKVYTFESIDKDFAKKVKEGDIVVAGENFGCGSSREQAPGVLKALGVKAVIAKSFARIFYRNATNVGVPLLEAPGITKFVENEEEIEVDMDNGIITSKKGETITFKKLPPFMLEILENGGLIEYLKQKRQ